MARGRNRPPMGEPAVLIPLGRGICQRRPNVRCSRSDECVVRYHRWMEHDGDDPYATPTSIEGTASKRGARADTTASRYQELEVLGKGGMGEVVAARDSMLGREVAIKRMLDASPSLEQQQRFLREARIQGVLDHPAIPPVHELAYDDNGRPYFVMKRLVGTTLSKILGALATGDADALARFPRQRLLRAFTDVCLAMELAHTRGIVHRDLKPSNIMLGEFGEVFILDWGVAKVIGSSDPVLESIKQDAVLAPDAVTQFGAVIGTPGYMSPEQSGGNVVDARSDIFALGCILFEILTITRVRDERSALPLRPTGADVPPELADLCASATAVDPRDRIATARLVGELVQAYLDGDRDVAMRRELATTHLDRGLAAAKRDDDASRREAMREAGRAMALDPSLGGAAELVGRLMMEPPREMPREVEAALDAANADATLRLSRIASIAYLGYLTFIPMFVAIGLRQPLYTVAFGVLLIGASISTYVSARRPPTPTSGLFGILCNVGVIAVLGRIMSPFMVTPGLAAASVMVIGSNPLYRARRGFMTGVTVLVIVGALAPWMLEAVGWVSPTMTFTNDAIVVQPAGIQITPGLMQLGLALYSAGLVLIAALVNRGLGRGDDEARRQVYLQSWQLQQLVPARS